MCEHVFIPYPIRLGRAIQVCRKCSAPLCEHPDARETSRDRRYAWFYCERCTYAYRRDVEEVGPPRSRSLPEQPYTVGTLVTQTAQTLPTLRPPPAEPAAWTRFLGLPEAERLAVARQARDLLVQRYDAETVRWCEQDVRRMKTVIVEVMEQQEVPTS